MNTQEELFNGDGINTVFKTKEKFETGSLKGYRVLDDGTLSEILVTSLGLNYVQVENTIIELGEKIKLTYNKYGESPQEGDNNLIMRIVKLEKAIEQLYEMNKILKQGLDNRVNVTTFQAWLRAVEKKLGIDIVEKNSTINQELYK